MPIINRQDAQEVELYVGRFFAASGAGRVQALRRLFMEKLDFASATGAVSLANAPRNVALPPHAERIATMEGLHVVYVPLSGDGPDRVRKAEATAAAKLIADALHGDLLLVMTNPSGSQLHIIYPTFVGAAPSLRRMIIEGELPRRTAVQQLSDIYWNWKDSGNIGNAVEKAFDVEAVTKEFFREYLEVFEQVEKLIQGFTDAEKKRLFTQTMFNRLMFIYFLSRKGWLKFKGDPDYLNALRKGYPTWPGEKNFYGSRLKVLFFAGLNNDASRDARSPVLASVIGDVPFLNGGLFDETKEDKRPNVEVPDAAIDQILHQLFDRFNFTVMESTPFDVEVAVDPEMLGKVFEELVTGRHESGSYYTPRPVVAFMCREALKGYLETQNTGASTEAIAAFVDHKDTSGITLSSAPRVGEALAKVKVVDPACGSGAYLLGMMQELVELMAALYSTQLSHQSQDLYNLKLGIIQKNLHGADIDQFAVNIAMLRLWLSLAIEYDGQVPPPLPNLDFKIVCGDSLRGPDPSPENYGTLFRHRIHQLAGQLADLKARHMKATAQEKTNLTKEIQGLKGQLREALADSAAPEGVVDWRVEFAEVFDEKEGFDIVVANPPYISAIEFRRTHPADERRRLNASFQTARGAYDLYVVFFERAIQLLHANGFLSFITPNKYLAAPYATALRLFLHSTCSLHSIVDLSRVPVFANTQVYPVLSFLSKTLNSSNEVSVLLPPAEGPPDFSPDSYRHISIGTDALNMLPDHLWGFLLSDGLPYLRKFVASSRRLELVAQVSATTTAAEADEYGRLLSDGNGEGFKVVNTGTIEPYRSLWGVKPLRDHGTSYQRPYLSGHHLSERRRNIYSAPKIIFAKIARTCEAILDERGDYAGLNVNCIYSPGQEISLEYLVAFLHSSVFNFIYQELFGSLRMAGGYLQFQAPQMRVIPIRVPDKKTHDATMALVRRLTHELDNGMAIDDEKARGFLNQIDEVIADMYGVTVGELVTSAKGSVPFEAEADPTDPL